MSKLLKDLCLKVAERYARNRFIDVEVHENPFGTNADADSDQSIASS